MLENTNIKQFYPGPILNKTLDITDFLFKDPEQVHITYTYKKEDGSLNNRELTYGTEYEVAKILPSDITQADTVLTASTGRVTLKAGLNVTLGERLTIYRESEIVQETQYPRTGPFPAASHEGALDYLTMQNQEQQDQIDRSLKVPISTANFDGALPIPVPARALKINNSGSGFELSEYDPDTALETTKEYMEGAQTAASNALASQNAAALSASSAANSEIVATQQATIATAKTVEVTETYNNAMVNITTNKEQSMSAIDENRISSIEEILNTKTTTLSDITIAGAEQVTNIKQTGFYMQDGKLYYIDSNGETKEFKSGGSGLEVCDIGTALYIDEAKGLRRRLNGQIVDINTNTQSFLTRLKQITTLYPSLLCTEEEWQAIKSASKLGQCGKFVFNYSGVEIVSVRIPAVVNINGLVDMAKAGLIKDESLPNIKGEIAINKLGDNVVKTTGALYNSGGSTNISINGNNGTDLGIGFNASRSSSTYQDNAPVQQEAIQYPYFIQIATGQETEVNIKDTLELNNPFTFGMNLYYKGEMNNISWLKSASQQNTKVLYPDFYNWVLTNVNAGKDGFKLSTASDITDYDFVVNTTDETFRLPLLNGGENLPDNSSDKITTQIFNSSHPYTATERVFVTGNFYTTGGTASEAFINGVRIASEASGHGSFQVILNKGDVLTTTGVGADKWAQINIAPVVGNGSLYYYVGETVQNANLIDAGRIGENLVNKVEISNTQWATNACMPDYSAGISVAYPLSSNPYTAPCNGMLCPWGKPTNTRIKPIINGVTQEYLVLAELSGGSGGYQGRSIYLSKGDVMYFDESYSALVGCTFYPLKGAK